MNITEIQQCADFFRHNYLQTFYLLITYNGKSFILIGEKSNFPHLMGIPKNTYKSHGYNNPRTLFNDIINRNSIHTSIVPNHISTTSKMYKKALNFQKSTDLFWRNKGPLAIHYQPIFSKTKLNNVDVLLTDIMAGYMLGWVFHTRIPVNKDINIEKYCICTWIDESGGTVQGKEKYMPGQDVELIRYIFSFDSNSKLKSKKEYSYDYEQKKSILYSCERNNSNLLIDHINSHFYIKIAIENKIHCKINGMQY